MEGKHLVEASYDAIATEYLTWTQSRPSPRIEKVTQLLTHLSSTSKILELGCGAGVPVTQLLTTRVGHVTANDISARQLELAKTNSPGASFVQGDMAGLEFASGSFDAVLAMYAFFHLPRDEHVATLKRICGWLSGGGLVLLNLAVGDREAIKGDFFGKEMFWSSFDVDTNLGMFDTAGFEIMDHEVRREVDVENENDPDNGTAFLWVLAKKR